MSIRQHDGDLLTNAAVFALLRSDRDFRVFFHNMLASVPFEAFFWELPALTQGKLSATFECVAVASDAFVDMKPDPASFVAYFNAVRDGQRSVVFNNLGGDAILVSPLPPQETCNFAHLAKFCHSAPDDYVHALWEKVSDAFTAQLTDKPCWLSTSGLGVAWLHFRIDSQPKYYSYAPYKSL